MVCSGTEEQGQLLNYAKMLFILTSVKEILEELDSGILEAISSFVDAASPEL